MKVYITALCCVVALLSTASADVLFLEDFQTPDIGGDTAISVLGWANDINLYDNRWYDEDGVNQGVWSWGATAYTEAFYTTGLTIDLSVTPELKFSLDNSSGWQPENTAGYFAIQLDSTDWYVSTTAVGTPTSDLVWATHSVVFDASAAAWNSLTVSGTGSVDAGGAIIGAAAGSALSGTITGVGVVVDRVAEGTMNFDNVTIESIPEPATLGLVGLASGALLFIRRRFMI